jgi:L-asparaginase II
MTAVPMIELWRGGLLESSHLGHAVICNDAGDVVQAWGDAGAVIYPRSACKMVQALPLIESGAADAHGLTERQIAFSCASHMGAALHRQAAADWLAGLGLSEADLRCGSHAPEDKTERARLAVDHEAPCQLHNNCSGKHSGFLTMNKHLKAGAEYTEIDHPLQRAIKAAFEEVTGEDSPGWGIDGCSAPNFATSVTGLARAMGRFAGASDTGDLRSRAMHRLTRAMATYPEMISGEGGTCTELMRAMGGRVTLKGGAEGVYIAILPEQRLGVALKIVDGSDRAKDGAITALLIKLGVLEADHPAARRWLTGPQRNWRGLDAAQLRSAPGFAV